MTQQPQLSHKPLHPIPLVKLMTIGGGIALALVILFLIGAPGEPGWSPYWKVRPLLIVTFAGTMGGLCYYILDLVRYKGGWKRIGATILSILIYLIGLWLGFVLGFAGTYWH